MGAPPLKLAWAGFRWLWLPTRLPPPPALGRLAPLRDPPFETLPEPLDGLACDEPPLGLAGLACEPLRFWELPIEEEREPLTADLEVPPLRLGVEVEGRLCVLAEGLLTVEEERELLLETELPLERELLLECELLPERETLLRLPLWLLLDGREAEEEDREADEEDEDLDVEDCEERLVPPLRDWAFKLTGVATRAAAAAAARASL